MCIYPRTSGKHGTTTTDTRQNSRDTRGGIVAPLPHLVSTYSAKMVGVDTDGVASDVLLAAPVKKVVVHKKVVKETFNSNGTVASRETTEEVVEQNEEPTPDQPKTWSDKLYATLDRLGINVFKELFTAIAAIVGAVAATIAGWFKIRSFFKPSLVPAT